jgi:hypothetical protein
VKRHVKYDEDIQAMERIHAMSGVSDEDKMHLAFGLGKAFEDIYQYDKAFAFFAEGNQIKRRSYNFSIDDYGEFATNLKEAFGPSLFAKHRKTGCSDQAPIFILGMPRSCTSLVEQILASHRHVYGGGELETLGQIFHAHFDAPQFGALSNVDFERLSGE